MFPVEFRVAVFRQDTGPREDGASLVRRGSACAESWLRSGQNGHSTSTAGGCASSWREVDAPSMFAVDYMISTMRVSASASKVPSWTADATDSPSGRLSRVTPRMIAAITLPKATMKARR